jgi:hypothetical protein
MAVTIVWFHDSSDLKKPHASLSTLITTIYDKGGELFGWCEALRPCFFHQLAFLEHADELNADEGGLGRLK